MADLIATIETSMLNAMTRMNSISHNIANASTTGYKRDITVQQSFNDHLNNSMAALTSVNQQQTLQNIQGQLSSVVDHKPGMLRHTGNSLDVSIEGNGYFEITGNEGTTYTRNGSFTLDSYGRLVTQSGEVVNGINGEIRLTSDDVYIDKQAKLWSNDKVIAQLRLMSFSDAGDLSKLSGSSFRNDNSNMKEIAQNEVHVRQGYLETSNVNSMSEMMNMISTMREFEMSQKVIKGYDEMLDTAINTLGEV